MHKKNASKSKTDFDIFTVRFLIDEINLNE